jgi:hypothetical protein
MIKMPCGGVKLVARIIPGLFGGEVEKVIG